MRILQAWYGAVIALALSLVTIAAMAADAAPQAADFVLTHARIYTAAQPELAAALAVRAGQLVYVGDAEGARVLVGPHTRVQDAHGRFVLPGLVDSHIHPPDLIEADFCNLKTVGKSLRGIADFVRDCLKRYRPAPGEWLVVYQWSKTSDNHPDSDYPNLRVTLDKAAPHNPVVMFADDGHHGAFNSAALALARNRHGKVVGLSRQTLASDFADDRMLIGVDAHGDPDGAVDEEARYLIDTAHKNYLHLDEVMANPEAIPRQLNRAGITAVLDASVFEDGVPIYEKLQAGGRMTVRATLALCFYPNRYRNPAGDVDYDGIVERVKATRAHFAGNPLVRADFFKIFADGEVEGNPFTSPPTLGNAAMLEPYLQPKFAVDAGGHATVTGYVDTGSQLCQDVRAHPDQYRSMEAVSAFSATHGFHPGQCQISTGKLQDDRAVLMELARRMHLAGFNLHIHVIGDRATRTAVDAIEAARAADGNSSTHDSLAHLQFVHPDDVPRLGRDHLYVVYTFSWASADLDYDMTVIPFIQHMSGNSYASRHVAGSYYEQSTYPFRTSLDAGAIPVGGSDAPVGTSDPQPFVNIAAAVARHVPGQQVVNAHQALTIREALNAYTIDGARFLGREAEFGSLEPGKSADFVIVDRNPLELASQGKVDDIAATRVLETWFRGAQVYRSDGRSASK